MANGNLLYKIHDIGKDDAVTCITVSLDTSMWSTRKKNIIRRALETGVANCGYDTGTVIEALTKAYGSEMSRIHKWTGGIRADLIRPEKLDEAITYVVATLKLAQAGGSYLSWEEKRFIETVDLGSAPTHVPFPKGLSSKADQHEFITTYLRDFTDEERDGRERLMRAIENGETVSVTYNA
jgi:hypothetical protein